MPRQYTTPTTTKTHSGYRSVLYRRASGRWVPAIVVSAGTGSTLNLRVPARGRGNTELTNVAKMTTAKQTNRWVDLY